MPKFEKRKKMIVLYLHLQAIKGAHTFEFVAFQKLSALPSLHQCWFLHKLFFYE